MAVWVEALLTASGTRAACIVGNSFGAALAACMAVRSPAHCLGLVLINGGPPPQLPAFASFLVRQPPLLQLITNLLRRGASTPSTLEKAFADATRAPSELRAVLSDPRPHQLGVLAKIVLAGGCRLEAPKVDTLVIWGAEDRLPGSTPKLRQRLVDSLPNARLEIVPDAGHVPQVEQPGRVADLILDFVRMHSAL